MSRLFVHISYLTGATLILSSALFAAPSPTKTQDESAKGAQLLKSVAADANQIQSEAAAFEKLANVSNPTWKDLDRQWNEIQPMVETMHMKIARLDAMQSSLSASEKQALEQSKADYQKIAWRSRDLGKLVDMVPPDLNNPKLKIDSRDLAKEASDASHIAKSGA